MQNRNSLGQDPCTVGSILDTSCRGLGKSILSMLSSVLNFYLLSAEYIYPPINSSEYYLPPATNHSGDVMCDCNSVMYRYVVLSLKLPSDNLPSSINLACTWPALHVREGKSTRKSLGGQQYRLLLTIPSRWTKWTEQCPSTYISQ